MAVVGALSEDGRPVPMPASVPLLATHRVDERSVLELVRAEDCARVVAAFLQALEAGAAVADVQLAGERGGAARLHYLDVRARHGVLLRAVLPAAPPGGDGPVDDAVPAACPRLAVMHKEGNARITAVDGAVTALLGWSAAELVGRQSLELIHPDDQARAIDNWMRMVAGGGAHSVRLRYRCRDGGWRWLETSNHREDGGQRLVVRAQLIDISAEMAATEALHRNERLLRRLIETVPVGLAQLDASGAVRFANAAALGLMADYPVAGVGDLRGVLSPTDYSALDAAVTAVLGGADDVELDVRLPGRGGSADRLCQVAVRGLVDAGAPGALLCVMDVTELKAQAVTDPLTRVANRTGILEALRQRLAGGGPVAVIFVDLDRFKPVNDRYGHEAGDRLLREVTAALRGGLREEDELGRIGGDEFLLVCPGLADAEAALALARRLRRRVCQGVRLPGGRRSCTASVGVAWVQGERVGAEEAVARADAAMYAAKRAADGEPALWPAATPRA